MQVKKIISCVCNVSIFVLMIFGMYVLLKGIKFVDDPLILPQGPLEILKYYTIQSNILMGLISCVYFIFSICNKKIPLYLSVIKLMGTVGVSLTLFTVVFYLAPISSFGYFSLFTNSNFFFHFFIPVLSIITFCFFENDNKLSFKQTIIGMSTMFAYALFYTINVITHIENGAVSPQYDWYFFVHNGLWTIIISMPAMFLLTFLISFGLTKLNNKMH